ncbi:MAG: hypothetical protein QM765_45170 [Myxococcales bacterium]
MAAATTAAIAKGQAHLWARSGASSARRLLHRGEALVRPGSEPLEQSPTRADGHAARQRAGEPALPDGLHAAGRRREGPHPTERLPGRDAEREEVGPGVDLPFVLLGRHVAGRAAGARRGQGIGRAGTLRAWLARARRHAGAAEARQAEVGDARPPVQAHEHVVRLEVAVDHPRAVRRGQPLAGVAQHREDLPGRAPLRLEPVAERAALDVLHGHERAAALAADVVDHHHIGVLELRRGARLGQQRGELLLGGVLAVQDLDGHAAVELRVVRAQDEAHAAPAQLVEQDVAPQARAALQARGLRLRLIPVLGSERGHRQAVPTLGAAVQVLFNLQEPGLVEHALREVAEQVGVRAGHGHERRRLQGKDGGIVDRRSLRHGRSAGGRLAEPPRRIAPTGRSGAGCL